MQVDHIFENHIYLISNQAVAINGLFTDSAMCIRFLEKLEKYISPLCEILHYVMDDDQFQILVKMRSREDFCAYFRNKKGKLDFESKLIPWSTHIFSQAMANLQSSTAIHYNRKFGRQGALFARRFKKRLVKSESELNSWLERMQKMKKQFEYRKNWRYRFRAKDRESWLKLARKKKERCAYTYYQELNRVHEILSSFRLIWELDLQGQFEIHPPKRNSLYTTPHFTLNTPP